MSNTVTTTVDGIPEDYEFVRIGYPRKNELYLSRTCILLAPEDQPAYTNEFPKIIIRKLFDYAKLYKQLKPCFRPGTRFAKNAKGQWCYWCAGRPYIMRPEVFDITWPDVGDEFRLPGAE